MAGISIKWTWLKPIKMALRRDWDHHADDDRPTWMRSKSCSWVPCKCKTCFHCDASLTTGHATPIVKVTRGRGKRNSVVPCGTHSMVGRKTKICSFCYMRIKKAAAAGGAKPSREEIIKRRSKAIKKCCGCNRYACGVCWSAHIASVQPGTL